MADDWDLRSNIKDKPGSQGTLFSGGKSQLNPQKRYPRGFTPERQREIDAALPKKITGIQTPPRESFNDQTGEFDFDYPHARAVVREAYARSSVPASDLHGLQRIGSNTPAGRSGEYSPRLRQMSVDFKRDRPHVEQVLVHELGHHVDNTAGNSQAFLSVHGPTDYDRGRGEAVADNYMETHFRPHPKHANAPVNTYDHRFTHETLTDRYPGYVENRKGKHSLSQQQFGPTGTERLF